MRVIQMTATTGADGHLRLDVPTGAAGATFEVAVVLHTAPTANGTGHPPTPAESVSSPGSLASLYGCITDESFVAPPRGMPRSVPPLDSD